MHRREGRVGSERAQDRALTCTDRTGHVSGICSTLTVLAYGGKYSRRTVFADWRFQKFSRNYFRGPRISLVHQYGILKFRGA